MMPIATDPRPATLDAIARFEAKVWPDASPRDRAHYGAMIREVQRLPRSLDSCDLPQLKAYGRTLRDYLEAP